MSGAFVWVSPSRPFTIVSICDGAVKQTRSANADKSGLWAGVAALDNVIVALLERTTGAPIGVFVEANINPCADLLIAHFKYNYQHRVKLTKVWLGHGSMTLITPDGRKERRTFEAPLSDADDKVWAHLVYEVV